MKLVVTSPSFSKNVQLKEELGRHFKDVKFCPAAGLKTRAELIDFLRPAEAAIVGLDWIDGKILDECPNLKAISKYGVGLDNIDLDACKTRGIKIGWRGGVNRLSVAELTLSFMIGTSRNVFRTSHWMKSSQWVKDGGRQLSGSTVGIIGVGHIGKEVIRLLAPFNCRILVNDIVDQSTYYKQSCVEERTLEDIFRMSDIVSIHTPLTSKTKNLVNADTLAMMKPTAYLINTARGEIVSQADLYNALLENRIAGAALDVYEEEPPKNLEFLAHPSLIPTPHIGGNSQEAVLAMGMSAIHELRTALNDSSSRLA